MLSICENRVGFFAQMYIGRSISIGGRTFRYPIWVYSFCASIDSDVGFPFVSRHLVQYDFRAIVTPNILFWSLCSWPGPLLLTQRSHTEYSTTSTPAPRLSDHLVALYNFLSPTASLPSLILLSVSLSLSPRTRCASDPHKTQACLLVRVQAS